MVSIKNYQMSDEKSYIEEEIVNKIKLSIWLDTYDDIFSDFDSRPFVERSLSDDFISEARKMSREKTSGQIELNLLMPSTLRDKNTEDIVIKSLHKHFQNYADQINIEKKASRRKGYLLTGIGAVLMVITAYTDTDIRNNFFRNVLHVIMEPAGWFLLWTGLDHIFYDSRTKEKDYIFNLKMANSEIVFMSL